MTGLPASVTPDEVKQCRKCDRRAIRGKLVKSLTPAERKTVQSAGILRIATRGLCDMCYRHCKADGTLTEFTLNRKNAAQEFDIHGLWERVRSEGGHYRDLAEQVGLTADAAQKLVKRLGLPEVPTLWEHKRERDLEFLEELTWLLHLNRGVYEIACQLGLTDDELIKRVDSLRDRGLTDLNLNYPNCKPLKEAA